MVFLMVFNPSSTQLSIILLAVVAYVLTQTAFTKYTRCRILTFVIVGSLARALTTVNVNFM
jgi:hypothetical protein